jgi:2-iminobutanoate/2-iminopropanoate deaminase
MRRAIQTSGAPKPGGVYSQAIEWNGLLFTAGVTPVDPNTGAVVGATIEEQTERVLESLAAILAEAGLGLADVLKTTVHLADPARDFDGFNRTYQRYFEPPYPARTTVGSGLRGILVEIDLVAGRSREA